MATPPQSCLAFYQPELKGGGVHFNPREGEENCGHGMSEIWLVVKNTRQPGCPLPTQFTYKEVDAPMDVRRQSFRDWRHPDLVESLAHAV
jgi:hypothetical protein